MNRARGDPAKWVRGLVLCAAALGLAAVALLLWAGGGGPDKATPLVVLKLPRSGSSWLTGELNEIPSVFVSKEIVQRGDRSAFSVDAMEEHFVRALQTPTGKLSSTRDYLPTGRFFEDYLLHKSLKVLKKMRVVGFTVNPEHCKDVQWQRVHQAVPGMRMVALIRSNVVKSALSGFRGKQTMALCGSSNLRFSAAYKNCTLPAMVDWSVGDFFREVASWQQRYDDFGRVLQRIRTSEHVAVESVYYEDLQLDLGQALTHMFQSIGLSPAAAAELGASRASSPPQSGWLKRSSEDLRDILTNFAEIEQTLQRGRCVCLLAQLRATQATVFPPCRERYDASIHECRAPAQ